MTAVDRLFLVDCLIKTAGTRPLLDQQIPKVNPKATPLPPPSSSVADFPRHLTTEGGGNYNLDVFHPPPFHESLEGANPAFTNNMRTLMIQAHGGQRGVLNPQFRMASSPYKGEQGFNLWNKQFAYPGMKQFEFGLPDVAKMMGPKTNDIHNLLLATCGSGGCAPGEAFRLFPNLTNVVHTKGTEPIYVHDIWKSMRGDPTKMMSTVKNPARNWMGLRYMDRYRERPFEAEKVFGPGNPKWSDMINLEESK